MKKYSVTLHGHATSISLEPEFWEKLCEIANHRKQSIASLIKNIDDKRCADKNRTGGLSSHIRLFILNTLIQKIMESTQKI